jgi:hypothetical protein
MRLYENPEKELPGILPIDIGEAYGIGRTLPCIGRQTPKERLEQVERRLENIGKRLESLSL